MLLTKLFKTRARFILAAAALFFCLAAASASAQDNRDIDSILWDIQTAIWRDEGDTVVRLLRQNGIDINAPYFIHLVGGPSSRIDVLYNTLGGSTALSSAAYQGCPNVVKALLEAGADMKNAERDCCGTIFISIHHGHAYHTDEDAHNACLRILIDYGADVNVQDEYGYTALMTYTGGGMYRHEACPDLVKILIDAGADVNIQNNSGLTALMMAERMGNAETAKLLRRARTYR